MTHEELNIKITRKWATKQARLETESGVTSVGGLAHRIGCLKRVNGPSATGRRGEKKRT
jgi:hypothetical protein